MKSGWKTGAGRDFIKTLAHWHQFISAAADGSFRHGELSGTKTLHCEGSFLYHVYCLHYSSEKYNGGLMKWSSCYHTYKPVQFLPGHFFTLLLGLTLMVSSAEMLVNGVVCINGCCFLLLFFQLAVCNRQSYRNKAFYSKRAFNNSVRCIYQDKKDLSWFGNIRRTEPLWWQPV